MEVIKCSNCGKCFFLIDDNYICPYCEKDNTPKLNNFLGNFNDFFDNFNRT